MDMKQNGFWIALAAGVGIAVIAFAALVLPLWTEESDLKARVTAGTSQLQQIKAGGEGVPTEQWVAAVRTNDAAVTEETKRLYRFFQAGDTALEAWFDNAKDAPTKGVMMSKASDGISTMMKELRAKMGQTNVPPDGKAFAGEPTIYGFEFARSEDVPEGDMEARKRWMRVYNIHTRMKDAMLEANATKFYRVQVGQSADALLNSRMKERAISNDLGNYLPFVLECALLWKDIPTLLAAIVRYDDKKPGPMFRIAVIRTERDTPPTKVTSEIVEEVNEEEYDETTWKPKTVPPEDAVKVTLVIEAYNFNFPEEKLR